MTTKVLHTPYEKKDAHNALSMPVYDNVAFDFDSAEAMEKAFCGRSADHTYSRITNPTVQHFEKRVRTMTDAMNVTALSSGMAAISNTLLNIASQGSNIVTSAHLFGNTYSFLTATLGKFGVEARFCNLSDPDEVRRTVDNKTCCIFLEIITNPQQEVADLKALSAIAEAQGIPLIADTTIVPFTAFRAADLGVHIEIISSTKYISGGATSLGGLIIDYGNFSWKNSPVLTTHIKSAGEKNAFTARLRTEVHRNVGAYMTPHAAYMQSLGLETLDLRFRQQATTCLHLAQRLRTLSGIVAVNYTGLEDNPFHPISLAQFGPLPGAMLTFDLPSREHCFAFMNRLLLIRRATNLFDNKSLAIHPASTIFGTFSEEQRQSMDVSQLTIRLSVGLETVDALFEDIRQAL
ncbi:MAG: PLP-dependent transferase [Tannerellaceae bacterium]|jgi:O-acetylhomoserine (thiol)-lyase|nr:PLP-dependent transferase [Tannerellaceae bacterium]